MRSSIPWIKMRAERFSKSSPRIYNIRLSSISAAPTRTTTFFPVFCIWSKIRRDADLGPQLRNLPRAAEEGAHPLSGIAPDRRATREGPSDDLVAVGGS